MADRTTQFRIPDTDRSTEGRLYWQAPHPPARGVGDVSAVDEDKLYIENFTYDGVGPDAFFWIGNGSQPSPKGHLIRYPLNPPDGKPVQLPRIDGKNILLHLPPGIKVTEMKWFSVWCRRFTVDFGHVTIPENLDPPRKRVLPEFQRLAHGLRSGNITILDARTFYIPNLHYDGLGPDAYFWVGKGPKPDPKGHKIPNEMGSLDILRTYEGEDIELQLPENLTVYDIDYLGIWCVTYKHNFGHVQIPRPEELWVPPALGQTRIKAHITPSEFDNCRQLSDDLQVEWQAKEQEVLIRLTARMGENQYIAFGLSPTSGKPEMLNSDIVVAYYDKDDGSFHAIDYSVTAKSQCDGTSGVCPDEQVNGRNDASVIGGERRDGITSITFSRPYETNDQLDMPISRYSDNIPVIAAIGQLNARKEANYHEDLEIKSNVNLDFRATGDNSCTLLAGGGHETTRYQPWSANVIRATTNFTAVIGPTGGEHGYSGITRNVARWKTAFDGPSQVCYQHLKWLHPPSDSMRVHTSDSPSWDIAWWINDMLIPEIYVERGQTYYFTVHGGNDRLNSAKYHPLYITSSHEGGFGQKTVEEQSQEQVFAGVSYSKMGMPEATAAGRLCKWRHIGMDAWEDSLTFEEYKETLYKDCDPGLPGSLVWTVDEDTPNLVYYQCYTHRNLGWKIHVVDSGYKLRREGDNGGCTLIPPHLLASILLLALTIPLR
ncbi:protein Skeletor, isoforms B/C-like [Homarus americanus]|uniref:protein Skeletor, isoforms B/C-like n=1 Tax=Homarus americanus TaxID=6706 RepID=UPI001C460315|nr:protein Skeletor, isoforms B/C-like [Homarus americanus]